LLSPAERTLRARLGAHALHAKHDARLTTAAARAALLTKFEREVDPDGALTPEERQKRAEHARKAHMTRIALLAARARSAKASKRATPQNTVNKEAADTDQVSAARQGDCDDAATPS